MRTDFSSIGAAPTAQSCAADSSSCLKALSARCCCILRFRRRPSSALPIRGSRKYPSRPFNCGPVRRSPRLPISRSTCANMCRRRTFRCIGCSWNPCRRLPRSRWIVRRCAVCSQTDMTVHFAFVHGGGQGGWVWEDTIEALRRQDAHSLGSLLTLDVPGCGKKRGRDTAALDVDDVADELIAEVVRASLQEVILV